MTKEEYAQALFQTNPLLHMDMSEAVKRGDGIVAAAEQDGALVYLPEEKLCLLSALREETAERLLRETALPFDGVVIHQRNTAAAVAAVLGCEPPQDGKEHTFCHNAAYRKTTAPPMPEVCSVRPLTEADFAFVAAHYTLIGPEGVRAALREGRLFGAFREERCCGFIGIHSEGAIGMLFVLPEMRRRGIAAALEVGLFRTMMAKGRIPYGQIFAENTNSIRLQEKMGLEMSAPDICWMMRVEGDE